MKLDFGLSSDSIPDSTKALWPYKFGLLYSVTLDKDSLNTTLVVTNDGDEPFDFQILLHTYFNIKVRPFTNRSLPLATLCVGTFFCKGEGGRGAAAS